jgi:Ca2+-transporting ATPase
MIVAVGEGRRIYDNIRKSVHFLVSTNLSEIIVMFTATAAGLGQPLNAIQLLWINLMTDVAPALGLAFEPPEPDVLRRPPRRPDDPIIQWSDLRRIGLESTVLSAGALGAYGFGRLRHGIGPWASTMAFLSLTSGQLLHAISCRSQSHSVFSSGSLPPNRHLHLALLGSFAMQLVALAVPGLRNLLGLVPLDFLDSVVVGASTLLPFVVNETSKDLRARRVDSHEFTELWVNSIKTRSRTYA